MSDSQRGWLILAGLGVGLLLVHFYPYHVKSLKAPDGSYTATIRSQRGLLMGRKLLVTVRNASGRKVFGEKLELV